METPFFVALTQAAWADLLADRDRPGDAERARTLADAALPVAAERGYGYVERDARSVLERIEWPCDRAGRPASGSGQCLCRPITPSK
jgi:hypothetical protein